MALYRTDMVALGQVRPLVDAGELEQAVDRFWRTRMCHVEMITRAITGNWEDAETFYKRDMLL